jgi:diacylglycerol kinase family enzyme
VLLPAAVAALGEGLANTGRRHTSVLGRVGEATVKGYRPVPYQVDGDYVAEAEHIELRWAPGVLSLVLPNNPLRVAPPRL